MKAQIDQQLWEEQQDFRNKQIFIYDKLKALELQNFDNILKDLSSLIDQDSTLLNQLVETTVKLYYGQPNLLYIRVLFFFKDHAEFNEFLELKIKKDLKVKQPMLFGFLKQLTLKDLIQKSCLEDIYRRLLINFVFTHQYDEKIQWLYLQQIQDSLPELYEIKDTSLLASILENRNPVCTIYELSFHELQQSLSFVLQYGTPKSKDLHLQVYEYKLVNKEINELLTFEYQSILQQYYDQRGIYIIVKIMLLGKFEQEILTGACQTCVAMGLTNNNEFIMKIMTSQEFKSTLKYRDVISNYLLDFIKTNVDAEISFKYVDLSIYLHKQGVVVKTFSPVCLKYQLIEYQYYSLKILKIHNYHIAISVQIIQINQVLNNIIQVEIRSKPKEHVLHEMTLAFKRFKSKNKYNFFDIENLISIESLATILDLIQNNIQ